MNKFKTGFMDETVDLNVYYETFKKTNRIKHQLGAFFIRFDVLDLDTVDESDEDFFNVGVREEDPQAQSERIDNLIASYEDRGWDSTFFPPCFGIDGKPRDGRGRIISAKRRGMRFIPIAVYEYPDDSLRTNLTCGLIANNHAPAERIKREDIVEAGLLLVGEGELEPTDTQILQWLTDEVEIFKIFRNPKDCSIIKNDILKRYENGSTIVKRGNSEQWKLWILNNLGLVDRKDYILSCVDNVTYVNKTWCENILPLIVKKKTPIPIIVWSGEKDPVRARKNVHSFKKKIDACYEASIAMVNLHSDIFKVQIAPEKSRPYYFKGATPQLVGIHYEHGEEPKKLINIKDY